VLDAAFERHGSSQIIVKPVVSTNATDTYLLTRERASQLGNELAKTFAKRAFVVQPFIESIRSEGEYSLFYFNRELSHATVKVPKRGDFRVQEEYGAEVKSLQPETALVETGDHVIRLVEPMPVYARVDFVRGPDGRFLVMELELIEPSMYLRMDSGAPGRFARAFNDYVERQAGATPA
jgi:glutathione synthase/RimK-type ligase-like ATP-grasp enzyme